MKTPTPDWLLLLSKFLRDGTSIASFAPSSRWLAAAMVEGIDFAAAKCIVELGAGTGPVTRELLRLAGPHCRCLIVERDADLARRLCDRFPRAEIIHGDACDLEGFLAERGVAKADHILSGLPLPSFPAALRDRLFASVAKSLVPGGTLRQLTVMPWVYQRLYRDAFSEVPFRLVVRNVPPGGIYVCRGGAKWERAAGSH